MSGKKKISLKIPAFWKNTRYNITDWFVAMAVFITIIWRPLVAWVLPFDSAGRVPFLLLGLAFAVYFKRIWKTVLKFPLSLYCILAVYLFVNGLLKRGYDNYEQDGIYLMFCAVFQAPAIMLIVASLAKKDFDGTINWILAALFFYPLLSIFFADIDVEGRLNGGLNANEIALATAVFTALQILKYIRNRSSLQFTIIILLLPLFVIIRTGSRMGLAMVTLIILAAILIKMKKRSARSFILTTAALVIFFVGFASILSNSIIGKRMVGTTSQSEKSLLTTGTILDKFGDRGFQYFYSFPYFLDHPVSGIGLGNWIKYSPNGLVCHSEYMVQYVENGLLAFIPYMIFFLTIIRRIRKRRNTDNPVIRKSAGLLYATMLSIVFSNSVLWSYNQYCIFIIYALCFTLSEDAVPARKKRVRIVLGSKKQIAK